MSNGGVRGVDNPATTLSTSGVWTLEEALVSTSAGRWPSAKAPPSFEYVLVAGGGGSPSGGGGGAGGFLTGSTQSAANQTFTVTIGAGGSATNGSDSVLSSGGSVFTAIGGGAGGAPGFNGANGGSGGGACGSNALFGGDPVAGQGTSGQGFAGGAAVNARCGTFSKTGACINYTGSASIGAGGGAGGAAVTTTAGPGVSYFGGFGFAAAGGPSTSASAAANTGNGGGSSNNGGSGFLVIRYPDKYLPLAATSGGPTQTLTGGYRYYTFTGSGSFTL